jgi:hypothetical protein
MINRRKLLKSSASAAALASGSLAFPAIGR